MSILPWILPLLVGVVYARHINYTDGDGSLQPITTSTQQRRICAELCMSGLGGDACGQECTDLTPPGLPLQFTIGREAAGSSFVAGAAPRQSACPVLCKNKLGYPLCHCDRSDNVNKRTDFVEVCGFYCINFDYQIYGCQSCEIYQNMTKTHAEEQKSLKTTGIDWNKWCQNMCQSGDGGAACNCDLLPMVV